MNATSQNLLSFIKNSPTPFQAISSITKILKREGFKYLDESEKFSLDLGGKYYVIRNDSAIIAFTVPESFKDVSFNIAASHLDSPSFKIKQNATSFNGTYVKLNVEGYGGMILSTWLDRPLNIAGRVIVKDKDGLHSVPVNFNRPLVSMVSVPIHLSKSNELNKAIDMQPVISTDKDFDFKELLANEINVDKNAIVSFDLYLVNKEDGYFFGNDEEFIASSKIDDLGCAYSSLLGFIKGTNKNNINVYCAFDNEEVGSSTIQGADSNFLDSILKRVFLTFDNAIDNYFIALAKSFLVSCDNGHALSPNHPELYDPNNAPVVNKGVVIKANAAQTYCTDSISSSIFQTICENAKVPFQFYYNKADIRGGSTLGNISATHVSVHSVDIGMAQFAMHSIMESAGSLDVNYFVLALSEFYSSKIRINGANIKISK